MCACRVWWMCVIISQLANIYVCTPLFVAYLDWQRCGPDWLVSLRETDLFDWALWNTGSMIKNYIAVISPLVGLRGLGSTSFIYSQVFALVFFHSGDVLHGCTVRMDREAVAWANKVTLTYMCLHYPWTRTKKPQWSVIYLYENSNWASEKLGSKNRKHPNPVLVLFQAWLSLRPQSEDFRWARTLWSIQKPQDHYSIWTYYT